MVFSDHHLLTFSRFILLLVVVVVVVVVVVASLSFFRLSILAMPACLDLKAWRPVEVHNYHLG